MGLEWAATLQCGQCGEVGALEPGRFRDNAKALQAFREQGWESEAPDDKHRDRWWQCPKCQTGGS